MDWLCFSLSHFKIQTEKGIIMNIIELHIIQSFPVTCLNRDDLGSPKSAFFGGVQRARISSQCWKRPIREMAHEAAPQLFAGTRSRLVGSAVENAAVEAGLDEKLAHAYSSVICQLLKEDDKEVGVVKTLLYFSPASIKNVVCDIQSLGVLTQDIADKIISDDEKTASKALDKLLKDKQLKNVLKGLGRQVDDAADIALFGRMVADDASQTVEGAAMFSHAISTHSVRNDLDFFSAVDDLKVDADDAGAGHIGTTEFNSACYYRYVGINLDLLRESNLFDQKEIRVVLENFIRACVMANPVARRNAMFGYTLPSCVLGLRRQGQPLSLANAFEKPVQSNGSGIVASSIEKMKEEWKSLQETFGLSADAEISVEKGGEKLDAMINKLLEGIK